MTEDIPPVGPESSTLKMDPNLAGALCYLFGCLSGILFFLLETENKRVRFHALQSVLLFTSLALLTMASLILSIFTDFEGYRLLNGLIGLAQFVLWLFLVIRTYQGHTIRIPGIGDFAQKTVGWP